MGVWYPFSIIAERATVLIFTGRRAKKEFFREVPGGIELAPDGRAYLIAELNKRLDRTVRYQVRTPRPLPLDTGPTPSPTASDPIDVEASDITSEDAGSKPNKPKFRKLKQRTIIQHEAHALANTLLGRHDIPRIVETEDIWTEQDQ